MSKVGPVLSRRAFILSATAVAGAGLVFGLRLAPGTDPDAVEIHDWITVSPDNTITIRVAQMEMGQGVMTSLPQLLAEELEADWSKVKTEYISIRTQLERHGVYGRTNTTSSMAVRGSQTMLRTCGAQIRTMFVRATSKRLRVPESELVAKQSSVTHVPTGRRLSYGELAYAAFDIPVPQPSEVKLKQPKEWTNIGTSVPRVDVPAKTDGTAIYGIDVAVPGMKYAAIAMCPIFGGKLKSYDAAHVLSRPGILKVVEIKMMQAGGKDEGAIESDIDALAVIADQWWLASKAVQDIKIEWDGGDWATGGSASILSDMRAGLAQPTGKILRRDGDAEAAMASAVQVLEAEYFVPYLEHATMEPMNCTALVSNDNFEVWAPTQVPQKAIAVAARVSGLPASSGDLHVTQIGGGFGRRLESDFVGQAVQIAKAMKGTPIKLLWSREDTMQHGVYRSITLSRVRGGLDQGGNLVAWTNRIVSAAETGAGLATANMLGYPLPNVLVDLVVRPCQVPTGLLRGVGHATHNFTNQCFLDELARAAGNDPYQFQRALLDSGNFLETTADDPKMRVTKATVARLQAVLDEAAGKSGWDRALGPHRGRGIAVIAEADALYCAVTEVTLDGKGWFTVDRVVVAGDTGFLVNPNTAEAQVEGSVAFALTSAMYGEITIERGRVVQSNFNDYPILRIGEMPPVEVHWVLSGQPPWGGVGEPVVSAVAPSLINAIYDAGGPRIRSLPLKNHKLVPRV